MMKKNIENLKLPVISFAGIVLLVIVAVFGAEILYSPKKMVKRGYEVKFSKSGKVIVKVEKKVDIAALIKIADIAKGEKTFKKCATCHNASKGAANKVGPNLYGVVFRKKAAISNFNYSDAMRQKGGKWSYESLNQFLKKPKKYVVGTKMGFSGLRKPQDRANVIAYLKSKK